MLRIVLIATCLTFGLVAGTASQAQQAQVAVSAEFAAAVAARDYPAIARIIKATPLQQRGVLARYLLNAALALKSTNLKAASLLAALAYETRALDAASAREALRLAFLSPDVIPIVAALFPGARDEPLVAGFVDIWLIGDTARQNLASPN